VPPAFSRTYAQGAVAVIDVLGEDGDVTVSGSNGATIEVVGRVASRRAVAEPDVPTSTVDDVLADPPVAVEGDTLRLGVPADPVLRADARLSYDLRVPVGSRVLIRTASGRVSVIGVDGAVAVRSESGEVRLERISGTAGADTASGSILASRIDGGLDARSRTGTITVRGITGPLFARTDSGRIHATVDTVEDVDVETLTAPVSIRGARGRIVATSRSGAIDVWGTPVDEWSIRSESGAIDARIGDRAGLRIDASTGSGTIDMDVPGFQGSADARLVSGVIGESGSPVRLSSGSGSIRMSVAR
jgi:DUF4097 and DUF4098 domain-containing protein YvlB